jgi:HEAT repeat protein/TolA-binding protein
MKFLMIAAIAPSVALSQNPPVPPVTPVPPLPADVARPVRPAVPPRPAAVPRVWTDIEPMLALDYEHKLGEMRTRLEDMRITFEPDIRMALESARLDMEHMRESSFDTREAQRVMERTQLETQRELQRAQSETQRELQRAQMDMERALTVKADVSGDRLSSARPRQGWAREDPADSLYRVARESLNRGEYRRAATIFSEVVKKYPKSQYALDSQYWEAFSRYRAGTTDDLREARKLLEDPKIAAIRSNERSMDVSGLRARVLGALAARGDNDAARELQKSAAEQSTGCDREEVSVRAEALNALGQMDIASAMPVVKKVLARRDECTVELRRRALYLLGRTPNAESVPLMLDVAKNDTDQGIRREAMSWLSRTAGDQAVPMFEEMLRTSADEQTQRSAVSALGSIDTERARKAIRTIIERADVQERVRAEAISSLARDRENRVMNADDQTYLRSLYAKMETQRLKEAVLSAVSRIEAPENEAWLLNIAKNENESPSLRAQALQRLGRMTTVSFTEIGKLYERADSRALRQQILRALSERKEPEAIDKLVEVAKKDTDPNIRSYAIQILARSNNPKALQGIKDLADRP